MAVPERIMANVFRVKAAAIALTSAFAAIELTTGQAVVAGAFAVLAAVLGAWLASRPNLIRERAHSKQSEEDRRIRWYQERIEYHAARVELVRQSKHNLSGYVEVCHGWMRGALKQHPDLPPFDFKYHDDLCGDEDKAMLHLTMPSEFAARSGEIHETVRGA